VSAAPANRILEVLAEPVALRIVRALSAEDHTQAQLVTRLHLGQSVASRALQLLRVVGLVESDAPRSVIRLRVESEVKQLLLAADRLAEALLVVDQADQKTLTRETRRTVIRANRFADAIPRDRAREPEA
jgi:DNA-binding transcriptional ArsR family regulator